MTVATWTLARTGDDRFPYRLRIVRGERTLLALLAQDRWPAAGKNVFCLRDTAEEDHPQDEEIECVDVTALQRRGARLSVVLDRARHKRCDFLFLRKDYKGRDGHYEQIFWQTQLGLTQRRPHFVPAGRHDYTVRIAHEERYPWRFPGATIERARLAIGDYALMRDGAIAAVVERKTFENMLADFGVMPLLHQRLLELSQHEHHALVIEAPYEDFLNPKRAHHYGPSFCRKAIADLYASHPRLRIVFCANRKAANEWTRAYFAAVMGLQGADPASGPEIGP